ncbi:MAG: hypothetical protein ABIO58_08065, partial [Luteimonas sp.]
RLTGCFIGAWIFLRDILSRRKTAHIHVHRPKGLRAARWFAIFRSSTEQPVGWVERSDTITQRRRLG